MSRTPIINRSSTISQSAFYYPRLPVPFAWRREVCRCMWTQSNLPLGRLLYVQESNQILIHFSFNSCWRLNSVGTDEINYPIHLLAVAGKLPTAYLWIIGRRSPSIRVSLFINAVCCVDQCGARREELTSLNVLQRLSCIITHLSK